MKIDHKEYSLKEGIDRINQITKARDEIYEERSRIPSRNTLTYTNGFYAKCTAIVIEIRDTTELTDFHRYSARVQQYRAYISELTAILNDNPKCAEINIANNTISAFFDTPWSEDIDEAFSTAAKISSIADIINYKFKKNNIQEIKIGIGISYGKALLIKIGYKNHNEANKVIWMGDVINEAKKLASYGNKEPTDKETMVSETIYHNLSERNKKLLTYNTPRDCYHGEVLNTFINNWYKQNCT